MEKKKDIIDRHSKSRAMLIEDSLLFSNSLEYFISELIDIAEISDYYDAIILTNEPEKVEKYLYDSLLESALVLKKYEDFSEIKRKYRFLAMLCSKAEADKLKEYYRCETLVH